MSLRLSTVTAPHQNVRVEPIFPLAVVREVTFDLGKFRDDRFGDILFAGLAVVTNRLLHGARSEAENCQFLPLPDSKRIATPVKSLVSLCFWN